LHSRISPHALQSALPFLAFLVAGCGNPTGPSDTPPGPPRISATRYVAFGDSQTEGKLGPASYHGDPRFPDAYVAVLYSLLTDRYTAQTLEVFDRGVGGEMVQPDGVARLPGVLTTDAPEVLLLLEGVNDLSAGGAGAIPTVISGLRTMIREARGRGITVFIATLLPQRPGGLHARSPALIAPTNDQIRTLAASEGANLVDLYQAFGGSPDPYIDADGLHPTVAGYQKMAATFFDAIRARLEITMAVVSNRLGFVKSSG